jgi:hypothetical protein
MASENDVDLDSIIDRLLEVRGSRPGKQVQLLEQEIRVLCTKAREIFISQPILLELEAPIKVCSVSFPCNCAKYLPVRGRTEVAQAKFSIPGPIIPQMDRTGLPSSL